MASWMLCLPLSPYCQRGVFPSSASGLLCPSYPLTCHLTLLAAKSYNWQHGLNSGHQGPHSALLWPSCILPHPLPLSIEGCSEHTALQAWGAPFLGSISTPASFHWTLITLGLTTCLLSAPPQTDVHGTSTPLLPAPVPTSIWLPIWVLRMLAELMDKMFAKNIIPAPLLHLWLLLLCSSLSFSTHGST